MKGKRIVNIFLTLTVLIASVVILIMGRVMHLGLLLEGPLLLGTFILMIKFRSGISQFFQKAPLPNFYIGVISSIPFILFEENINCLQTGCNLIPQTLPILLIFIIVLGLCVKFLKLRNMFVTLVIFSVLGFIFEVTIGSSGSAFRALSPVWFVFLALWVALSYAYLALIPLVIWKR